METVRFSEPAAREDLGVHADLDAREGLESLVRRHQGMVWRYLRLLGADETEADDLMQETLLRVSRGSKNGERLRAPAAFLRAIARNLLIGARRAARLRTPTVEWAQAVDQLVADDPTAFEDARMDALRVCRTKLRGKARLVVELHYIEGFSYRESAQKLGLGVNGVKALLSRARQALRDCVKRQIQGDLES